MDKKLAITLVLLLCAIIIGISGVAVLLGEQQVSSVEATINQARTLHPGIESFSCDPRIDPSCVPCDPLVDPGCRPPG